MSSPGDGALLSVAPGVVLHPVDDCFVAYEPRSRQAVALNPTASDVVVLCDGTQTRGQVVAALSRYYARPAEELAPQVRALVEQLAAAGVLTVS